MPMENLSERLNSLLQNPEALAQLQSLASSLGGGQAQAQQPAQQQPAPQPEGEGLLSALSGLLGNRQEGEPLLRMAPLLSGLHQETDATRLLHALRPLLSPARRQRLDAAVRLIQFMRVLPLLRGSGLL